MSDDYEALKGGINRILNDAGTVMLTHFDLRVYGEDDWPIIKKALADWESRGI